MISIEYRGYVNCATRAEQEIILDIFEMLGMTWRQGQNPRGYESAKCPMYYALDGDGTFAQGATMFKKDGISASEYRNQWISLKIKKEKSND